MTNQERDKLESDWLRLLAGLNVPEAAARQGFDELAAAYAEPARFYHTLDHVAAVLGTNAELADLARDPAALQLAAWFHDAVYDPRASDNEERSAALARSRCDSWGITPPTADRVRRLSWQPKRTRSPPRTPTGPFSSTPTSPFLGLDRSSIMRMLAPFARSITGLRRRTTGTVGHAFCAVSCNGSGSTCWSGCASGMRPSLGTILSGRSPHSADDVLPATGGASGEKSGDHLQNGACFGR